MLDTFCLWMVYLDFVIKRGSSPNLPQPGNRGACRKLLRDTEVRHCLPQGKDLLQRGKSV